MSALNLVTMSDGPFNAILRAMPLEALDLISAGDADEYDLGMARVPDDVWAEFYALTYGIDTAEFLDVPEAHRRAYLEACGEVPLDAMQALTPLQMNVYYDSMAGGDDRQVALVRAKRTASDIPCG